MLPSPELQCPACESLVNSEGGSLTLWARVLNALSTAHSFDPAQDCLVVWPSVYSDSWKTGTLPSLWPMLVPGSAAQSPGFSRAWQGSRWLGMCPVQSAQTPAVPRSCQAGDMLMSSAAELCRLVPSPSMWGIFCFSSALRAVVAQQLDVVSRVSVPRFADPGKQRCRGDCSRIGFLLPV